MAQTGVGRPVLNQLWKLPDFAFPVVAFPFGMQAAARPDVCTRLGALMQRSHRWQNLDFGPEALTERIEVQPPQPLKAF